MKKSLLISALVLILIIAGCGNGDNKGNRSSPAASSETPSASSSATEEATPSESANAEPVSIIAYAFPPDKTQENISLDAQIKRFQEKQPHVTITPEYWKYENTQIAIKMASNSAQTEFTTWATEARLLTGKKWIADLTDYMANWEFGKDLNEKAMEPYVIDGKTYGVPIDAYGVTVTINKKLFADKGVPLPPLDWTWDELIEAAKAINDPAKGIAGIIPMGTGTESGWNWTNFLYSAGGDVQTVADGKVTAAFNSEAGLKALQLYKDLKDANVIPKTWAIGYGDAMTLFQQGRGGMILVGNGNAADQAINQGGLNKDDIALYPIPSVTKGGKHLGIAGGNYKVINGLATKEQQKAAFDFVVNEYFTDAYLESIDAQIAAKKAKNEIFVPQMINYWNDSSEFGKKYEEVLAKHDNVYKFDPALNGLLESKLEATYEVQAYYGEMANVIQKVFTSKGDIDLQQLLDDAAAKVQKNIFDKVVIPE
ncbi:ABC transporter substrate-binding protein [Cohnella lupini]|uniref:ABC-type glycerol-3-phosphate transport system substrate-binding protein n=1 Tax=Cohnella lupini TaxID=1294267 RepID=A0A3D9I2X9_9BACL|nr:sugar ABC transporter substrate-binding protein [Cohnella lupini]RED55516.1 ABC-type glycerol-3-phosphate transport system substrate-binding protein [Cohnella lupini]